MPPEGGALREILGRCERVAPVLDGLEIVAFDSKSMGITERRAREKEQRTADILKAAWRVATTAGWASFSVERVAAEAELGRATIYGYFESLETLVLEMAREAHRELSERIAQSAGLPAALDVPVRFAQSNRAGFALLFPPSPDPRPAFCTEALLQVQTDARQLLGHLQRLAERSGATLPEDARSASAFLTGIAMAGAVVPELSESTTLRRKWQDFCLDGAVDTGQSLSEKKSS